MSTSINFKSSYKMGEKTENLFIDMLKDNKNNGLHFLRKVSFKENTEGHCDIECGHDREQLLKKFGSIEDVEYFFPGLTSLLELKNYKKAKRVKDSDPESNKLCIELRGRGKGGKNDGWFFDSIAHCYAFRNYYKYLKTYMDENFFGFKRLDLLDLVKNKIGFIKANDPRIINTKYSTDDFEKNKDSMLYMPLYRLTNPLYIKEKDKEFSSIKYESIIIKKNGEKYYKGYDRIMWIPLEDALELKHFLISYK